MNPSFRWPSIERFLKDRIWSDVTAPGSVVRFWVSGSIELRLCDDQAVVEEMSNAAGIPREQFAFARKQSRLEPGKILMLESSSELTFTTILVRAGVPVLVQLETSRLLRGEGLECYRRYVEACREVLAGKQPRP